MTDPIFPGNQGFETNSPQALSGSMQSAIKNEASTAQPPGWERAMLEKLTMAAITEQRQARRWRNGIRLGWLLFLVG
ncbi:MAG: S49 family peptidase, partial [Rhodoferax sp.]